MVLLLVYINSTRVPNVKNHIIKAACRDRCVYCRIDRCLRARDATAATRRVVCKGTAASLAGDGLAAEGGQSGPIGNAQR